MNAPAPLIYNGYSWNEKSEVTIEARNKLDTAGRTAVYTILLIAAKGYVTSATVPPTGTDLDGQLDTMRQALMAQGGSLTMLGRGYGQLKVNSGPGDPQDVLWGPTPQVHKWKAVGQVSAYVEWTCEIHIPICSDAVFQRQIMEHNWKCTISIDAGGYTTRTISGHFMIPQTRTAVDAHSLQDCADAYIEQVWPAILNDCIRTLNERTIDESKCRCDYTLRDEQFKGPNRPPPGAINCKASHTVRTSQAVAAVNFDCTLTAQYQVQSGTNPATLYKHFVQLVRSRCFVNGTFPPGVSQIIPRHFMLSEPELYGEHRVSATLFYNLVLTTSAKKDNDSPISEAMDRLGDLPTAAQLWSAPPQNDYATWAATFLTGPGRPRGLAGVQILPSDDTIIDLCKPATPPRPGSASKLMIEIGGSQPAPGASVSAGMASFSDAVFMPDATRLIKPESSWLDFRCFTRVVQIDNVCELKPLPPTTPNIYVSGTGIVTNADTEGVDKGEKNLQTVSQVLNNIKPVGPSSIIQQRCDPSCYLYLIGEAVRVGYQIDEPYLAKVDDVQAVAANTQDEFFDTAQVGNLFGAPVTVARWRRRWLLDRPPQNTIPVVRMPAAGG